MIVVDQPDVVGAWVAERTGEFWIPGQGTAIGFTRGDVLIGGVSYSGYNGANVWCSVASDDHRWINRATLWAIFAYPLEQLACRRITALVDGKNTKSQRFVTKLGFRLEATLTDAAPDGDQLLYVMWRDDCRWLSDQRYKGRTDGKEIERLAAACA